MFVIEAIVTKTESPYSFKFRNEKSEFLIGELSIEYEEG